MRAFATPTRKHSRAPAPPGRLPVVSRSAGLGLQRAEVRHILHGPRFEPERRLPISQASPRIQRANRLQPSLPLPADQEGPPSLVGGSGVCIPTTSSGGARTSSASFEVYYEKDNSNRGEISLRQREDGDRALHTESIPGLIRNSSG